ncbi:hypothetical protein [Nonomuraea sp. NPDC049028]
MRLYCAEALQAANRAREPAPGAEVTTDLRKGNVTCPVAVVRPRSERAS